MIIQRAANSKYATPGERSVSCFQDTLKTSMCANRLFPTARLSCKQLTDLSLETLITEIKRHPCSKACYFQLTCNRQGCSKIESNNAKALEVFSSLGRPLQPI